MPKVAKALMGIFEKDEKWDQEEEEARTQEKAAQEQVGGLLSRTMLLHSRAPRSSQACCRP